MKTSYSGKEPSRHRNKIIVSGVSLILFVFLIGTYLLINYISSPLLKWEHFKDGVQLSLEVKPFEGYTFDDIDIDRIAESIKYKFKELGIKKNIIKVEKPAKIMIQLPRGINTGRLESLITMSGFLEFKIVDEDNSLEDALKGNIARGSEILYMKEKLDTGLTTKTPYLVKKDAHLIGKYINDVRVTTNQFNDPCLSISLDNTGAKILEQVTAQNIGLRLAIILDNNVYSAPKIQEKISGCHFSLCSQFTMDEARDLALILKAGSGSCPAYLHIVEKVKLTKDLWLGDSE